MTKLVSINTIKGFNEVKNGKKLTDKKKFFLIWFFIVLVSINILLVLEYFTLAREGLYKAYKISDMLIAEIENILKINKKEEKERINYLKEVYNLKAQTIAYILDNKIDIEYDKNELDKLKNLIGVDEIHLFNEQGTIYSGTRPEYYGFNFDAGIQMQYFKPMLKDKTLKMNQGLYPNTAESKMMMYSICWNKAGNIMVQVGIDFTRLLKIIKENKIEKVISGMSSSPERDIILIDECDCKIIAATKTDLIGKYISDIGIYIENESKKEKFADKKAYYSIKKYGNYRIIIAQYKESLNKYIPVTILTLAEHLLLVFIAMTFFLDFMYEKFVKERRNALRDKLTGMFNRREYENVLLKYKNREMEESLCFVSIDINGLKQVNDTLGHSAGDELIKGVACCIKQVFESYGKVFRIGGDEFSAIIFTDKNQIENIIKDFKETLKKWSEKNNIYVYVSLGFAFKKEYHNSDINELSKIADKKMYENKVEYYQDGKHNRRAI